MWNGLVTVGEHVGFVWKDTRGMGMGNIWNNNLRSAFSASPIIPFMMLMATTILR